MSVRFVCQITVSNIDTLLNMLEHEPKFIPIFKDLLSIESVSSNSVTIGELKQALVSKLQIKIGRSKKMNVGIFKASATVFHNPCPN